MKTLDEVIKACEETISDVDRGVPIEGCYLGAAETRDALHYLKAHKNQQDFYDDGIKRTTEMIDELQKTVAEYLSVNNPPLSWQELKQMEGKPVWVEFQDSKYNGWRIVEQFNFNPYYGGNRVILGTDEILCEKDMGVRWQAYRKERE